MSDEEFDDLTEDEIKVLEILGRLCISENKNVNEHTVRKRLPKKYHRNFNDTIKNLRHRGLIRQKRKENYDLTPEGLRITQKLAKNKLNDTYKGLHILLVINNFL